MKNLILGICIFGSSLAMIQNAKAASFKCKVPYIVEVREHSYDKLNGGLVTKILLNEKAEITMKIRANDDIDAAIEAKIKCKKISGSSVKGVESLMRLSLGLEKGIALETYEGCDLPSAFDGSFFDVISCN